MLMIGYAVGYTVHTFFSTTVWAGGLGFLIVVAGSYIHRRYKRATRSRA